MAEIDNLFGSNSKLCCSVRGGCKCHIEEITREAVLAALEVVDKKVSTQRIGRRSPIGDPLAEALDKVVSHALSVFVRDLECWRCGKEKNQFKLPSHPDGGGSICHECWTRMFGEVNGCPQGTATAP